MATTVTLDSGIVDEIKALTGASTKTRAVHQALLEYLRAERRREMIRLAGKIPLRYTNRKLEAMEGELPG
ncbi:MAG TPA: type II toxin-antitoxin system VapB family antitoxin [Acidobacteriota bacterium]|nr:type II toxin-antitoxin system VapB family antitoxin [Acidobacteriota bacterium]